MDDFWINSETEAVCRSNVDLPEPWVKITSEELRQLNKVPAMIIVPENFDTDSFLQR